MSVIKYQKKSSLLFFILDFLLLFHSKSPLRDNKCPDTEDDDSLLFFILVFLKLFY